MQSALPISDLHNRTVSAQIPRAPTPRVAQRKKRPRRVTRGGTAMAQELVKPRHDDRIARALADPKTYFAQARERARKEIVAEMAQERSRPTPRRRPA